MIKIFHFTKDFKSFRESINSATIGIVPTMGNLHEGHLSLLKKSIDENDVSVITIFVNPKQFGPKEDFTKYPRTLEEDIAKISNLAFHSKKEIVVYAPLTAEEIYPQGFSTIISVKGVSDGLEGALRPGHFDGVTTVVYQLFKIINPDRAYFGQKDFQQCAVITKMAKDLKLDIAITIMPIIRNSEGLALSSRNQYLNENEREQALALPKTLKHIENLILAKKDYSEFITQQKKDSRWDYLEVLDADNLQDVSPATRTLVIIGAFRLQSARLLDNILVNNL